MSTARLAIVISSWLAVELLLGAPGSPGALSIASAQQDRDGAPPQAEAEALFERGVAAIDAGRYADGIAALERSLALLPRVPTAFNLAIARRGIGDFLGTVALLERIERGELGPVPAGETARLRALIDEARAQIGELVLSCTGTVRPHIEIDGAPIADLPADAPLRVPLNPGTHRVAARAIDHSPFEREITIAPAAHVALAIRLEPAVDRRPGTVIIDTNTTDTVIAIAGVPDALGHLEVELPPGDRVARLSRGGRSRETRFVVIAGRRMRLELPPPDGGDGDPWLGIGLGIAGGVVAVAIGVTVGLVLYRPDSVPSTDWPTTEL